MQKYNEAIKKRFEALNLFRLSFLTFLLYIFSIPFQKRIEFLNERSFIFGSYIDYTTIVVYLNDFLLVAALLFLVAHYIIVKKHILDRSTRIFGLMLLAFFVSQLPSLIANYSPLALVTILQTLLLCLLSLSAYIYARSISSPWVLLWPLILAGTYQSLIAITQFTTQHWLGYALLGESPFTPTTLNVAKIVVRGDTYVRAYGTFPHPNVLAGFLVVTLSATFTYFIAARTFTIIKLSKLLLWLGIIVLQFTALILTFSRSGWLGAVLGVGIPGIFVLTKAFASQESEHIKKRLQGALIVLVAACVIIIVGVLPYIQARGTIQDSNGDYAASERTLLLNVSRETFFQHPLFGTGPKTFLANVTKYTLDHNQIIQYWQYQPVHNIYYLVLVEYGISGFTGVLLLILLLLTTFLRSYKKLNESSQTLTVVIGSSLLSYLVIGLFDHHPWDIHQSQLTIFLLIGMLGSLVNVSRET